VPIFIRQEPLTAAIAATVRPLAVYHVISTIEPIHVPASESADARLVWIGEDDRGIELEIVALDLTTRLS
jgi:hypothetical protein